MLTVGSRYGAAGDLIVAFGLASYLIVSVKFWVVVPELLVAVMAIR